MPDLLQQAIARSAERDPSHEALREASTGWSHAALDDAVGRMAGVLSALVAAGARVGLLLPNSAAVPVALYGTLRAGARPVLLNTLYSAREVAEYLADAGAETLLTVAPLAALAPAGVRLVLLDALPDLVVRDAASERRLRLADHTAPPASTTASSAADGDEAAVIYTAAQFGWARGARLSHRNLVSNLRSTIAAMQLGPSDRVVAALPLMHAFGLTVTLNAPLAAGAAVIPVERFNPLRMLDLFEQERATIFAGVPAMYLALLAAAERRGVPAHALRVAICGGAPLAHGVAERWEQAFGLPLREGYGITEAGPVCLFNRSDRPNRTGTLGYPFPDVEVAIRDELGGAVPDGEIGEICIRGDNVFLGYVGRTAAETPELRDGWLRTGDLGSVEPDGGVRFRGVVKPMFTRNGFNIYPRELQRVLEADPRIEHALVCALPDAEKENEIVLQLRPAAGTTLSVDDVRELCRQKLAAYKQPGRIVIGDAPAA